MSAVPIQTKREARSAAKRRIAGMPRGERILRTLPALVKAAESLKGFGCVLAYWPRTDEMDITPLIRQAQTTGRDVYLPRVNCFGLMEFRLLDIGWHNLVNSRAGRFVEVNNDGRLFQNRPNPAAPVAVLLPGLAFAPDGRRLGRGGGFYDRFLSQMKTQHVSATSVALCFDCQITENLPTEEHDIGADIIITPTTIYNNTEE